MNLIFLLCVIPFLSYLHANVLDSMDTDVCLRGHIISSFSEKESPNKRERANFSCVKTDFFVPFFQYAVGIGYVHRAQTPGYQSFIANIDPKSNFRSYWDIHFILRQRFGRNKIGELKERLFILTQGGVGLGLLSSVRILKNAFVSLHPAGQLEVAWFSQGLRDYANIMVDGRVGCDFKIMPKGFVTFRSRWIPRYDIRYSLEGGELRTFRGRGLSLGVRFVISHQIVNVVRILGLHLDFERMPMEYSWIQVKDSYTRTRLIMHTFGIEYQF